MRTNAIAAAFFSISQSGITISFKKEGLGIGSGSLLLFTSE